MPAALAIGPGEQGASVAADRTFTAGRPLLLQDPRTCGAAACTNARVVDVTDSVHSPLPGTNLSWGDDRRQKTLDTRAPPRHPPRAPGPRSIPMTLPSPDPKPRETARSGAFAVFRSSDPLEAGAVAAALEREGIPATVHRDPEGTHLAVAAAAGASPAVAGARPGAPRVVVVPSSARETALATVERFLRSVGRTGRPQRESGGPIEGERAASTRREKALAWISLVAIAGGTLTAAVYAARLLLR